MLLSALILLAITLSVQSQLFSNSNNQRTLLADVQKLNFIQGSYSNSRRSSAILQLNCVGGTAKCDYYHLPKTVTCTNAGFHRGQDIEWRCEARFDNGYKFGEFQVSCEGYDYADDPYILKDSCGLEYELDFDYAETRQHSNGNLSNSDDSSYFIKIILFAIIGILIYAIYKNRQDIQQQQQTDPGTNSDDSSSHSLPDTNDSTSNTYSTSSTHSSTNSTSNTNSASNTNNNRGGWNWNNIGFSLIGTLIGNSIWSMGSSLFFPRRGAYNAGYNRWGGGGRTWGSGYSGTSSYSRSSGFSSGGSSMKSGFGGTKRR